MSSSSTINDGDYYNQQAQPSQSAITAFLAKLWALVNDPSCNDLIAWDSSGASFHVYDQARFAREVLPRYFKHNNFASFIRQLNMYGFRKISTIEHGSLKNERDDIEFAHPNFIRGQETLLESIKRRAPDHQPKVNLPTSVTKSETITPTILPSSTGFVSNTYAESKSTRPVELSHLFEDVKNLQTKQTSLTDKLFHMQDENQALWREVGLLKQKHAKQQQIVSKLMEFLLHFLTTPTTTHRPSVEHGSNHQSQVPSNQHKTIVNPSLTSTSLKRKPAAIMLGEEPRKRTTMQQQQQQQQQHLSHPINIGEQRGIIINELSDNDSVGVWPHTTNASPLVDLVPSPPPSNITTTTGTQQHPDETFQAATNNFDWAVPTDELRSSLPFIKSIGNGNHSTDAYIPDFFLNSPPNKTLDEVNLSDINTSLPTSSLPLLKEEQIDFSPNTFNSQQTKYNSIIPSNKNTSTISIPFSLDDITDDVHHIQTSLDNIREFMFDNLPDGTTIDDLFSDDPTLLSPLLATTNILSDDINQTKSTNDILSSESNQIKTTPVQCKQLMLHKSEIPMKTSSLDVDNHLLDELINDTVKVDQPPVQVKSQK